MQPRPNDPGRFKRLPARARGTTTGQQVTPARDPYGGRDTDRDFLTRYGDPFED
jgi:hypothetical protein